MTRFLSIDGVTKRFGRVTAVDRLSLEIRENEFFALLGASGSGKTTLLRMLAGFETPEEGAIRLDGADIARVPPNRRPVNLMFQSYALFPHMTVEGNIAYGLEMERLPRAEIAARVGNTSLAVAHQITDVSDGRLYADGMTVIVWVDPRTQRPRPLPDFVRQAATR